MNIAKSLSFKSIGSDVQIFSKAQIINSEYIIIGDSVIIDDFVFFYAGVNTIIGSFVHIAAHSSIAGRGDFIMEDFAGISGGVRVYTGNEDYLGGCLTGPTVPEPYRTAERSYVILKKHVVVGANSVILPGVTIGEGAVIGANSLVTRDVPSWTVNVGSPAKPIGDRPRQKIYELETELKIALYKDGKYIPKSER